MKTFADLAASPEFIAFEGSISARRTAESLLECDAFYDYLGIDCDDRECDRVSAIIAPMSHSQRMEFLLSKWW